MATPLILLAALGLGAPNAEASTLLLSTEQLTDASDYIVRGVVTNTWVDLDEQRGIHWTRVQLEVNEVFKGPEDTTELQLDIMGGFLNGKGTVIGDVPRFSPDEEVLVFVEVLESGILVPVGLKQGKMTIRIDPFTGQEMLVIFAPSLEIPYDHRFIPNPSKTVFLTDMMDKVQKRISQGWDGTPIPGKSNARLAEINGGVR